MDRKDDEARDPSVLEGASQGRRGISRREFLKIAAGASGAAIGAGVLLPALERAAEGQVVRMDPPRIRCLNATQHTLFLEVCAGPSGAAGGFEIQWVGHSQVAALVCGTSKQQDGLWPASACKAAFIGSASCSAFSLAPNACTVVEIGNLQDATCIVEFSNSGLCARDELDCATEYVFRARARTDGVKPQSLFTANLCCSTEVCVAGCVRTQGYWRNHPEAWPVSSLLIGSITYSQADLLTNLGSPAQGNAVRILSHQLIAAKLNIASGASGSAQISDPLDPSNPYNGMTVNDVIATADALINGSNINTASVAPSTSLGQQMVAASRLLDLYNNGDGGVAHCP